MTGPSQRRLEFSTRRRFFAVAAVGLPFLLGASHADGQRPAPVGPPRPAKLQPAPDPVLEAIFYQMRSAYNSRKSNLAASAQRHADALRMLAAYGRNQNWDKLAAEHLRSNIAQPGGRDAMIANRMNMAAMKLELAQNGLQVDPNDRESPLDFAGREKALDRILRNGLTAEMFAAAAALEAVVPELRRIQNVRQPTKQEQKCAELEGHTLNLEFQTAIICALAAVTGWFVACVAATAGYFGWKYYIASEYGCY